MKRLALLMMVLATMLTASMAQAQTRQTLTRIAASGTDVCEKLPVFGLWADRASNRTQMIYPSYEFSTLSAGDTIESLRFYVSSGNSMGWSNARFVVKMANVNSTSLAAGWDTSAPWCITAL